MLFVCISLYLKHKAGLKTSEQHALCCGASKVSLVCDQISHLLTKCHEDVDSPVMVSAEIK